MSDTGTGSKGRSGAPAVPGTRGLAVNIALWVLQAALALQFAFAGFLKVSGAPAMVDLFAAIGAGQWMRYFVGAVEIAGAVGILIPLLSGLAALGLAALMAGATVTNLFVIDDPPWIPIAALVMAALVAWGRWPRITAVVGRLTS